MCRVGFAYGHKHPVKKQSIHLEIKLKQHVWVGKVGVHFYMLLWTIPRCKTAEIMLYKPPKYAWYHMFLFQCYVIQLSDIMDHGTGIILMLRLTKIMLFSLYFWQYCLASKWIKKNTIQSNAYFAAAQSSVSCVFAIL